MDAEPQSRAKSDASAQVDGGGIHLFRIAGIRIIIDYSWFFIFALVVWSLSAGYFPGQFPDQTRATYWTAGIVATLLFFASILVHELAHSFVAMAKGIHIPSITLFVFGGVSRLSEEAKDPATELKIAIVGPLSSFLLAALFYALQQAIGDTAPRIAVAVLEYLAFINLALGIFNLFPGFPLDGGRVLRAIWWWKTGSLHRATRVASEMGKGFALALMFLGGIQIFAGQLLAGLWLVFIGMFLRGTAAQGYHEILLRQYIEGVPVERVMTRDVVTVSPDVSLRELVDDFFLVHGYRGYPVVEGMRPVGMVNLEHLKGIPKEELPRRTVASVMSPFQESQRLSPTSPLTEALERFQRQGVGRLIVMDDERVQGILTRTGLERLLETRRALESYG